MFFFMMTKEKQQCHPLCFFSWRPIKNNGVTAMFFFMTTNKKRVLPLVFFFMTTKEKQQCYPQCFVSWRPIKNDLYFIWQRQQCYHLFFFTTTNKKTTVLPLVFFFMTTKEKQQCYPLCFTWSISTGLPLMFISWRPIKNNIVTPYVFFLDDQYKTTVLPLMCFYHDDQ